MQNYKTKLINFIKDDYLVIIFLLSFASVAGSLYFQFFLNLPPCNLCYVQRYFMYPLLPIAALLILFKKKINSPWFLILSVPGILVAIYHVYIQSTGTPNISFIPCSEALPCEVIDIKLFGFLTIPMMSLMAFAGITVLVILSWWLSRKSN
ncbi:MAG: disulfide bond formation protein B [Candidatus Dojkabacteria bacterium]